MRANFSLFRSYKSVAMIHLKKVCDTRRQRKDGTYPIVFRISLNRQHRFITTGYSCKLEQWDADLGSFKPLTKTLQVLNERLKEEEFRLLSKLREYELNHDAVGNIQQVKLYLSDRVVETVTVRSFWIEEVNRLEVAQKFGNAKSYKETLGSIESRMDVNIPFKDIDYKWLIKLETKLRSSGVGTNAIAVYMRTLRALINKAISSELADASKYPFRRYRIKSESTSPRMATIEELHRFFTLSPNECSNEFNHWLYGKLILLLRGINFYDLALLTKENIKHGRMVYNRSKTHKRYSVEILPETQAIINYFEGTGIALFPILSDKQLLDKSCHNKIISQKRKVTNKWLAKMGASVQMNEKLTTYVFRYSIANVCKRLGYSKDMISESLGHAYGLSVSSCYLEAFDLEAIDDMHRQAVGKILSGF